MKRDENKIWLETKVELGDIRHIEKFSTENQSARIIIRVTIAIVFRHEKKSRRKTTIEKYTGKILA